MQDTYLPKYISVIIKLNYFIQYYRERLGTVMVTLVPMA